MRGLLNLTGSLCSLGIVAYLIVKLFVVLHAALVALNF
jgi:hypothetical protein